MEQFLVFEPEMADHALSVTTNAAQGVPFPAGATSGLLIRYVLKDGKAVDRFAKLSDEKANEAFTALSLERDAERRAQIVAKEAEADRAKRSVLTRLAYLLRFTAQERIGIRASTDPVIQDFIGLVDAAQEINLMDPNTVAGTQFLETKGAIGKGRAAEILAI